MPIIKPLRLLSAALLVSLLCGCSGTFMGNDRQLMRPPYPAGEEKNIQEELIKQLGNVTLKYPKSGAYRSAILRTRLTRDNEHEKDDALVFYREKESEPISLAILNRTEKGWRLTATKKSEGGEVDRVMFGDIDNDGVNEIIVGWTMYSTGLNIISAYSFDGSRIMPIEVREFSEAEATNVSVAYTDMQIGDFDNDDCDEIIASYLNLSEVTATAKLIEFHHGVDNSNAMSVTDTAPLDGHVLSYADAKVAKLTDDNIIGVVLDGNKDNSTMITEYVYWDMISGDLKTPFYNEDEKTVTDTVRNLYTTARDIDSDGVMEIPVTSFLPGYDQASYNPVYLTSWYSVDFEAEGCSFISRKKTVINPADNYSVTWLSSWNDRVTCRIDPNNHILYFYRYRKDKFAFSDEIFRIKVYSTDEWDNALSSANESGSTPVYSVLAKDGDNLYVALFALGQDFVDVKSVASYFNLLQ